MTLFVELGLLININCSMYHMMIKLNTPSFKEFEIKNVMKLYKARQWTKHYIGSARDVIECINLPITNVIS